MTIDKNELSAAIRLMERVTKESKVLYTVYSNIITDAGLYLGWAEAAIAPDEHVSIKIHDDELVLIFSDNGGDEIENSVPWSVINGELSVEEWAQSKIKDMQQLKVRRVALREEADLALFLELKARFENE